MPKRWATSPHGFTIQLVWVRCAKYTRMAFIRLLGGMGYSIPPVG